MLTALNVPNTASYQTWVTVSAAVSLAAGNQTLRIISTAAPIWNINWIEFDSGAIAPKPIPGKIEAEAYDTMQGIQMEKTADTSGDLDVGWIDNGDWLNYTVNALYAGTYTVSLRVASPNAGGKFEIRNAGGTVLSAVPVPKTGGYQTWSTVTTSITIPAGTQTLRIISTTSSGWNLNWINFTQPSFLMAEGQHDNLSATVKEDEVSLRVTPNPVSSSFVLQVNNKNTGMLRAQIINMQGAVVKEFKLDKNVAGIQAFQLPANDLGNGTYVIRVQLGNWSASMVMLKL